MSLPAQIGPGSRVRVSTTDSRNRRQTYCATVVEWTPSGKLKVKPDPVGAGKNETKTVSADNCKLIK